jgi:hypothetical protein
MSTPPVGIFAISGRELGEACLAINFAVEKQLVGKDRSEWHVELAVQL